MGCQEAGGEQPSGVAATQQEAIEHAESFARRQAPSRVVIHSETGTIVSQHSFDRTEEHSLDRTANRPSSRWRNIVTLRRVAASVAAGLVVGVGVAGVVWLVRSRD